MGRGEERKEGEEEKVIGVILSTITAYLHPKRNSWLVLGRGAGVSAIQILTLLWKALQ